MNPKIVHLIRPYPRLFLWLFYHRPYSYATQCWRCYSETDLKTAIIYKL